LYQATATAATVTGSVLHQGAQKGHQRVFYITRQANVKLPQPNRELAAI